MDTLIAHPDNQEQYKALRAFLKALKINFEERKSPYDATFVSMIEESKKQAKQGKIKAIKTADLWK